MSKMTTISLSHLRARQLREIAKRRGIPITELILDFVADQCNELGICAFHDAYLITTVPDADAAATRLVNLELLQGGRVTLPLSLADAVRLHTAIEEVAASRLVRMNMTLPFANGSLAVRVMRRGGGVAIAVDQHPHEPGAPSKGRITLSLAEAGVFADNLFGAIEELSTPIREAA